MKQYLNLLEKVLWDGEPRVDRTGTGIVSIFGTQSFYDLQEGFPLVTTKKVHVKSIIHELIWFLNGDTNVKYLQDNGVRIWDEWVREDGTIGKGYGHQWRSWGSDKRNIDQIKNLIEGLKKDPTSRRHIVSAWNVDELETMALPPCHTLFQFYVREGTYLDCQLYQRSADLFLGVPFNIASYAMLIHLVAKVTDYLPGKFIHTIGDAHIYNNHIDQVQEQLKRKPLVKCDFEIVGEIDPYLRNLKFENFQISNYESHPAIKGEVSV